MKGIVQTFIVHNAWTKVFSVLIALILWIVVLGSRNIEVTKEIPIEVVAPTDLLPANEIPDRVAFRLEGPKAFLRAILDRREDPIKVNLAGSKAGMSTYRIFADSIRVPIGVKVLAISPAAIAVKLEPVKHRDVTIKAEIRGIAPEGFHVVKTEVRPPSVRIKGPESRVEFLSELLANPVDVSNSKQSFEKDLAFDLTRLGVEIEGPTPKLWVEIEGSNANFRVKNIEVRVLSPFRYQVEPKTVTVFIRSDEEEIRKLDRSKFYGVIDLRNKPAGKYPAQKIQMQVPEEVGVVKVQPESVDVTLY